VVPLESIICMDMIAFVTYHLAAFEVHWLIREINRVLEGIASW
jgi:hypothetical protein